MPTLSGQCFSVPQNYHHFKQALALSASPCGVLAPVKYCSYQSHLPGGVITPKTLALKILLANSLWPHLEHSCRIFSIGLVFSHPSYHSPQARTVRRRPRPAHHRAQGRALSSLFRQKECSHVDAAVDLNARDSSGFDVFLYLHLHHSYCSRNLLFSAHNQDVICIAIFIW